MTARSAPTPSRPAATPRWSASTARSKALAMTTDCTPRYCYADPYEGGKQAIAEAYRNLCAVGAKPLAITNCLNFGNPQRPEIMAQIVGCLEGMSEACRRARLPDRERQRQPLQREQGDGRRQRDPPDAGDRRGRAARRLGEERDDRVQGRGRHDRPARPFGRPCRPVAVARRLPRPPRRRRRRQSTSQSSAAPANWFAQLIEEGLVNAVHDISDGGALVAIAEMALAGGHRRYALPCPTSPTPRPCCSARIRGVSSSPRAIPRRSSRRPPRPTSLRRRSARSAAIGVAGPGFSRPLADLRAAHEGFFPELMGADAAL